MPTWGSGHWIGMDAKHIPISRGVKSVKENGLIQNFYFKLKITRNLNLERIFLVLSELAL
jgi:hypothetical protein